MRKRNLLLCIIASIAVTGCNKHTHVFETHHYDATCTKDGYDEDVCSCGYSVVKNITKALGHSYVEDENDRYYKGYCLHNCGTNRLTFDNTFRDSFKVTINTNEGLKTNDTLSIIDKYLAIVNKLPSFSSNVFSSTTYSQLTNGYGKIFDEIYNYATEQYGIAMALCSVKYDEKTAKASEEAFSLKTYIKSLKVEVIKKIYESSYRDRFINNYLKLSTEDLNSYINSDIGFVNDPEYKENTKRAEEIYNLGCSILDRDNKEYYDLYYDYVDVTSKKVEAINNYLGYEAYSSYLDYSYINDYRRDYTIKDVYGLEDDFMGFARSVKTLIQDKFDEVDERLTIEDQRIIGSILDCDITKNSKEIALLGEYFEQLDSYIDNDLSFANEFNDFLKNRRLFVGDENSAYTNSVGAKGDIIFMGTGYKNTIVFSHEFGHYIQGKFDYNNGLVPDEISYEIAKSQSQGCEFLFDYYLNEIYADYPNVCEYLELINLKDLVRTLVEAYIFSIFEDKVYSAYKEGHPYKSEEYNGLFIDLVNKYDMRDVVNDKAWQRRAIMYSCYMMSYPLSLLPQIELYVTACEDGLESAAKKYEKYFGYYLNSDIATNDFKGMLENAGVYGPYKKECYDLITDYILDKYATS